MEVVNLYTGYEGEPEMVFSLLQEDTVIKKLCIWDGHFSFIIESCKADNGEYQGLACPYHSGYLDDKYVILNLIECLDALVNTNISNEDKETQNVYYEIIKLFQEAIEANATIYIETL